MGRWRIGAGLIILILFFSGCASVPTYKTVENSMRQHRFDQTVLEIEKKKKSYGKKNELLYYFDRIWADHLAGNYESSNEFIEKANLLIDELYTKSVSSEAMSFIGNDLNLPFEGENFERVMIHVVGMLNYVSMRKFDEALVEARRADQRMKVYVDKYGADNIKYSEDALARYLSAVLYENSGEYWDAYIDYKKTDQAFDRYQKAYSTPKPEQVGKDLLRLSAGLGETEDHERFEQQFPGLKTQNLKALNQKYGEVIVFLYEGLAPVKETEYIQVPVRHSDNTVDRFAVAFPRFRVRNAKHAVARLMVGEREDGFELFQDISAIAFQDLQDRIALIRVKAIARATAKYQASRALTKSAKKENAGAGLLMGLVTDIYKVASEQADTRSWQILPARIHIARMAVRPGKHNVEILVLRGGNSQKIPLGEIDVAAGEKKFLKQSIY